MVKKLSEDKWTKIDSAVANNKYSLKSEKQNSPGKTSKYSKESSPKRGAIFRREIASDMKQNLHEEFSINSKEGSPAY